MHIHQIDNLMKAQDDPIPVRGASQGIGVAMFAMLVAVQEPLTRDRKGLQNLMTTFLMVGGGFCRIWGVTSVVGMTLSVDQPSSRSN